MQIPTKESKDTLALIAMDHYEWQNEVIQFLEVEAAKLRRKAT